MPAQSVQPYIAPFLQMHSCGENLPYFYVAGVEKKLVPI